MEGCSEEDAAPDEAIRDAVFTFEPFRVFTFEPFRVFTFEPFRVFTFEPFGVFTFEPFGVFTFEPFRGFTFRPFGWLTFDITYGLHLKRDRERLKRWCSHGIHPLGR